MEIGNASLHLAKVFWPSPSMTDWVLEFGWELKTMLHAGPFPVERSKKTELGTFAEYCSFKDQDHRTCQASLRDFSLIGQLSRFLGNLEFPISSNFVSQF